MSRREPLFVPPEEDPRAGHRNADHLQASYDVRKLLRELVQQIDRALPDRRRHLDPRVRALKRAARHLRRLLRREGAGQVSATSSGREGVSYTSETQPRA